MTASHDRARRSLLAGALAITAAAPLRVFAAPDLDVLARTAAGIAQTAHDKTRNVVQWTHDNLEWTATDYKARSVSDVIERGGGNCREQGIVVLDFLNRVGVECRMVREVNVQPANDGRQRSSEAMIAKSGPRMSVFGRRHNDHVWIEYADKEKGEWVPSDPTLNIVGYEPWVRARLGFGARPVHNIVPYKDMLFPITVLAVTPEGDFVSRSRRYLHGGFVTYYPCVGKSPAWDDWQRLTALADTHVMGAFRGAYNLHQDDALITQLMAAYDSLKTSCLRSA